MTTATFTNKEEYLQFRKEWKANYKQLSQTIREKKWLRKEYNQIWNKAMIAHGHPFKEGMCDRIKGDRFFEYFHLLENENLRYLELKDKYANDRNWVELYSANATLMLEELKFAKAEAQRQYLASKQQELVTA